MSCVLIIRGSRLKVDELINTTKLKPYKIGHKGEPQIKSKPTGRKLTHSFIAIDVSKANFDSFKKQISDSIRFLKRNYSKLSLLKTIKGIQSAELDFGIALKIGNDNVAVQSETFPAELLRLAGELGISIEISIYP